MFDYDEMFDRFQARIKARVWQKSSTMQSEPFDEKKYVSTPSSSRYTLVYLQPTYPSHSNHQSTPVPNISTPINVQSNINHYRPTSFFPSSYIPVNYNTYTPYDRSVIAHHQPTMAYPPSISNVGLLMCVCLFIFENNLLLVFSISKQLLVHTDHA
jgi:hypothetical protein